MDRTLLAPARTLDCSHPPYTPRCRQAVLHPALRAVQSRCLMVSHSRPKHANVSQKSGKMAFSNSSRRRWRGPPLGGRLQRGCRFAFAAHDGEATTAEIASYCRPEIIHAGGKPTAIQLVNHARALRSIGASNAHARLKKRATVRNLQHRPLQPALKRGRVQRAAMRALWALGRASTGEIVTWTCAMKLHRGERLVRNDYWSARRALASVGAERVGRGGSPGRPIMWRLPDTDTP